MSTQKHPPKPVRHRRQLLHEIEFFEVFSAASRELREAKAASSIRAQLLDPRLQRIVTAAANGWVVERYTKNVTSETLPT